MTDVEILKLLVKAKELGITETEVEAFKYKNLKQSEVPEMDAEDIVKSMPVFEMPTEEEVLYYATPYYDELQAKKRTKAEAINEEVK